MPNLLPSRLSLLLLFLQCFCVESVHSSPSRQWLHRFSPRNMLFNDVQPVSARAVESKVIWLPQDEYSGKTFFDRFDIQSFPDGDPTHGMVNYLNRTEAQQKNLFFVQDDGTVIMKADNATTLQAGQFRDSIRIQSQAQYTTGLFILDLNHAPWGCAIWPAFWTTGASWPANGEVDIIEGVHDNEHNQVAWHTLPGCTLNPQTTFSGNISSNHTDCNTQIDDNAGCSITEWSRASYGPFFDSQGGGVFAMKWDNDSIGVWSFYRAAVPQDIVSGSPDPDNWGIPSAMLDSSQCNISQYFANHNIIFDITFCGDWAGNSYATSGCPGTCEERLMDPSNFDNASWSINSLKVYKRQVLNGEIENSASTVTSMSPLLWTLICAAVSGAMLQLLL